MTFDEIESRHRAAVPTAESGGDEWDDPETDDADDDELGYRDADEEQSRDETPGEQGENE
jgi:hypothetical protein